MCLHPPTLPYCLNLSTFPTPSTSLPPSVPSSLSLCLPLPLPLSPSPLSSAFLQPCHSQGLYDSDTIATILKVAESACEVLERGSGRGHIVLSGCGTSGRLAFVVTVSERKEGKLREGWRNEGLTGKGGG